MTWWNKSTDTAPLRKPTTSQRPRFCFVIMTRDLQPLFPQASARLPRNVPCCDTGLAPKEGFCNPTIRKEIMIRKLSYLVLAGATAVSFSAIAEGNHSKQSQAQSDQTHAQSDKSSQSSQSAQGSQSPETVKQAQEKLSAAGMDTGPADGKVGPKTQAAVKEFQQSKGIQASGKLDQQTLAALGVSESSGSAGSASSGSTGSSSGASTSSPSSSASSPSSSSGASTPSASDKSSGSTGASGKSSKY